MSERALKQLVGALAVVIAVWSVAMVVQGGSGSGSIEASGEIASYFGGLGSESVTSTGTDPGPAMPKPPARSTDPSKKSAQSLGASGSALRVKPPVPALRTTVGSTAAAPRLQTVASSVPSPVAPS